jgi:hypothetical protein
MTLQSNEQNDSGLMGATPAIHFKVTRSNFIFQMILGGCGGFFLGIAWLVAMKQHSSLWIVSLFFAFGIVLVMTAAHNIRMTVDLNHSVVDYLGLFGRKKIDVKDVIAVTWSGGRGTVNLTIRTPITWIMVSNLAFTRSDLDAIAEFVYAGAEAVSNNVLRRPIQQKSLKDIPQKRASDF